MKQKWSASNSLLLSLHDMVEEYNCRVTGSYYIYNYLSFNPKRNTSDKYRLTIGGADVLIAREEITTNPNGRNYFSLSKRTLLSVDLHNPHSLETIRAWLETL